MLRLLMSYLFVTGSALLCSSVILRADEAQSNESQEDTLSVAETDPPEQEARDQQSYKVVPRLIKIEATLDGYFVAAESAEISLWPESWSEFKIKEVVPHGARVHQGETLLRFDDQELNKAIDALEVELNLEELRIQRAEQALPQKERSLERQLADAEEALKRINEDFSRYREIERKQSIDSANMRLKVAKFNLDYYKDELEQLQKMYEADDLTEETEEIVLRRQKFLVEFGEFNYEMSKYFHDQTLTVDIPRRDRDMEQSLENVKELLKSAQIANQVDASVARYELEKQRAERKKSLEKHLKLLSDRNLMVIKSPRAGIVYYGDSTDGKWNKIAGLRQKLIPGKAADKQVVLLTVLDVSELRVIALMDEKLRMGIKEGQRVEVQSVVEGSEPLEATVASISATPVAEGKFELQVDLGSELPAWLVPGMSCKLKVVTYEQSDALLVPKKAVHQEEATGKKYVWTVKNEEVQKTWVETGRTQGDDIEITSGLSAGEIVSCENGADKHLQKAE